MVAPITLIRLRCFGEFVPILFAVWRIDAGFSPQLRHAQSYGEPGDVHDRDIYRIVSNEQAASFCVGMDKGENGY